MSNATTNPPLSPMPASATEREDTEQLWYLCTACAAARPASWDGRTPQKRERALSCNNCGSRTLHRLAGLGPISRKRDCPSWCTDHWTIARGIEQHSHRIVVDQGRLVGEWTGTWVEIIEDVGPSVTRPTGPQIHCGPICDNAETVRRILARVGLAITILDRERSGSELLGEDRSGGNDA